ncbi:MAG: hypothetical protein N3D20_01560 [Candidatus Pacearchaeota archaeon]|nr:hypothetical protein [Candidatus Pacearchaeota archaeon]
MRVYIPRTIGLFGFNCWLKSAAINCIVGGVERGVFVYSKNIMDNLPDGSCLAHRRIENMVSENNGENYFIYSDCGLTIEKIGNRVNRVYFAARKGELSRGILKGVFDLENYVVLLENMHYLRWVRCNNGVDFYGPSWFDAWEDYWQRKKAEPEFFEIYKDDLMFDTFDKHSCKLLEHPWIAKDSSLSPYLKQIHFLKICNFMQSSNG